MSDDEERNTKPRRAAGDPIDTLPDSRNEGTPAEPVSPEPGERLGGRYVVIEKLGSGGFGSVHRAKDTQLDREVALKLLHGFARTVSSDELDAAISEGRALAQLQHPNIVPIFDAGRLDGVPFLSMGLVRGRSLDRVIAAEGVFALPRAVHLIEQLCEALSHAHSVDLVHRDVKPVNVIVDDKDCLQLVDFGIALRGEGSREQQSLVSGTLGYIAPEVLFGAPADARSDQFAAAVTFHEMLTGRCPFSAKTPDAYVSEVTNLSREQLAALSDDLPPIVRTVVARALSENAADRYPTCKAFAEALREVVDAPARRRRRFAATVAAVALSVTAFLLWPSRPLEVTSELRGLIETRDGSRVEISVDDRAALTVGDWFWLDDVNVTEAAYVHVLLLDSAGEVAALCPGPTCDTSSPLRPGIPHRLPPAGSPAWQLDASTGFESVFVLASTEPMTDDRLRALVNEAKQRVQASGSGASSTTRGVRVAPLPNDLEHRTGQEHDLVALLGDHFDLVRSHRLVHE